AGGPSGGTVCLQGYSEGIPGNGYQAHHEVRPSFRDANYSWPPLHVCVALSHPGTRGQRDDAAFRCSGTRRVASNLGKSGKAQLSGARKSSRIPSPGYPFRYAASSLITPTAGSIPLAANPHPPVGVIRLLAAYLKGYPGDGIR